MRCLILPRFSRTNRVTGLQRPVAARAVGFSDVRVVAIIGAAGQLGTELMGAFADVQPVGLTHDDFELTSPESIRDLFSVNRFDLVINTAAFHNVEACEREPDRAFAVNAVAVERLAAACSEAGASLAHVSTDYVFDGARTVPYEESDRPQPLNVYGISKLAGELLLERRLDRSYIFRTGGLYAARGTSAKGKPFIERMLEAAAADTPLRVVGDVTFSPSYAKDVAAAIRRVVERGAYGLYHVTNSGACTWHEFASEIVRQAGYEVPIEMTSSREGASTVRRPAYSALAHRAMDELKLPPMLSWQSGIQRYLQERG